jgi:aminoglycoside phosphotransferase (APT) family kinase protein
VRVGEELPLEALLAWLREQVPEFAEARPGAAGGNVDGAPTIEQFPAGHSNLTYRVAGGGREWVLRRPPLGARVNRGHDMGREYRILKAIHRQWPKVPRPVAYCGDPAVIGAPFYLMERVRGRIPRGAARPRWWRSGAAEMSRRLVATLAEIHALDVSGEEFAEFGRPDGYVARQVKGWGERYAKARTDEVASMERVHAWLREQQPAEQGAVLIHNDFKYDNLIFDAGGDGEVAAVLDWEMATVGDPLMDLGTTLAYWVDPGDPEPLRQFAFGPTATDGSLDRAGVVAAYREATGRDVPNPVFYYAFGLYKVSVIAQQIYWRYAQGLTRDPRFAMLLGAVHLLSAQAEEAISRGRLGGG